LAFATLSAAGSSLAEEAETRSTQAAPEAADQQQAVELEAAGTERFDPTETDSDVDQPASKAGPRQPIQRQQFPVVRPVHITKNLA
jgi:hypothetical protein